MNKEICNWCKETMGNSLHTMYGNPIHIRCEKAIRDVSKNDNDKWTNSQSMDKHFKELQKLEKEACKSLTKIEEYYKKEGENGD